MLRVGHEQQLDPLLRQEPQHDARNLALLCTSLDLFLGHRFGDLELLPLLDALGHARSFVGRVPVLLGDEALEFRARVVEDHVVAQVVAIAGEPQVQAALQRRPADPREGSIRQGEAGRA